jgi:hypothetical protein
MPRYGLSEHAAQLLQLRVGNLINNKNKYKISTIRNIDNQRIQNKLSSELWQNVFQNDNNDVNRAFNSFLNVYLQLFCSCFPKISVNRSTSNNQWITKGIINS